VSTPDSEDYDKELESGPLHKKGFTGQLQQQIEQKLAHKEKSRKWFAPFLVLGGSVAVLSAVLLFPWHNTPDLSKVTLANVSDDGKEAANFVSPTPPISTALLIGLRTEHESKDPSRKLSTSVYSTYRTLLIAPVKGELRKTSEGNGILMPYKQSFWKIEEMTSATPTDEYRYLSAHPADQPAKPESFPEVDNADTQHSETLVFAGNQYLSIVESEQAVRGDMTSNSEQAWVRTLPQLKEKRTIDLATEKNDNGYVSLTSLFGNSIGGVLDNLSGKRQMIGIPSEISGRNWIVARTPGRWVAKAAETYSVPGNHGEGYVLHDFPRALPEKVSNHDMISYAWSELKSYWPKATDALTSPMNDLIVIFEDDKLSFYSYGQSPTASPLLTLTLQPGEQLVMAQWATDHYVQEWIDKVGVLLSPPKPPETASRQH
jgi:hypothetical protein